MKNIKSIKISNFQSHKNTQIDFAGPGCLTVITGPSDSGKTAIIRALRWVFYNVPQGTDYITVGEDKCAIAVEFEDGTIVERIRTRGGVNRYKTSLAFEYQVFEGFGTGVPLEVQQATGIRKLQIGDQSFLLNLSEQLDGPFLGKSVPGSARAKVLGKLAGTEEIDFAGKEVGTDLYRARRQKEDLEDNIGKITEALTEYDWIQQRENQVERLQVIISETKATLEQIHIIKVRSDEYDWALSQKIQYGDEVERLLPVEGGLSAVEFAAKMAQECAGLSSMVVERAKLYSAIAEADDIRLRLIHIGEAEFGIDFAQGKQTRLKDVINVQMLFARNVNQMSVIKAELNRLKTWEEVISPPAEAASSAIEQLRIIQSLNDDYAEANTKAVSLANDIDRFWLLLKAEDIINAATASVVQLPALADSNMSFIRNKEAIKKYQIDIQDAETNRKSLENDYLCAMAELGKCPTCGAEINIERLREVI